MRKFEKFLILLFLALTFFLGVGARDKTFRELSPDTSPTADDLLITLDDPSGTPQNKKVTVNDLRNALYGVKSIDSSVPDQGVYTTGSVKHYVDGIGTSKSATLLFAHDGTGNTTTYTFSTSVTISSNIRVIREEGAILHFNDGAILTQNGPFESPISKAFTWTGSGKITFGSGAVIYPELWGIDGTADDVQLQAANDSIASFGGTVRLQDGRTYVVSASKSIVCINSYYRAIQPSSNVNWIGGTGTIVQLADNQTAGGHDAGVFITNTAFENVTFENFTIDLNGANNDLASNKNTPAIFVFGDNAYAKHIRLKNMTFQNCPGMTFVALGGSNSVSATLSDDIVIDSCRFYQTALDSDTTDHSTIYSWGNNIRISNCLFENESDNTNGHEVSSAWEFHGSNCIATGNTIRYYVKGGLLGCNYVAASHNQVMDGNTFEKLLGSAADVWRTGVDAKALGNLVFSNNIVEQYDKNVIGGSGVRICPNEDVSDIVIVGNDFYKTGGLDQNKFGVYISPANSATVSNILVQGNKISGATTGCYLASSGGTIEDVSILSNVFRNLTRKSGDPSKGVFHASGTAFSSLIIKGNSFIDDQVSPTFDDAIYLLGTITDVDIADNSYLGLDDYGYKGNSFTTKVNNEYKFYATAEATGGADTFIITATLVYPYTYFALTIDVLGDFAAHEGIFQRYAATGELYANTMYDGVTSEIFSIGDVLKANLTAGNPTAVGADAQLSITFTNADDSAFSGTVSVKAFTYYEGVTQQSTLNGIQSIDVANNQ